MLFSDIYNFRLFENHQDIVCGISTRVDGTMIKKGKLDHTNIAKFLAKKSIDIKSTVFMSQVHGKNVSIISDLNYQLIEKTDGLITKEKNIFLCVVTADCLPMIFFEPNKKIVGIIHAGYRGILLGVIEEAMEKFIKADADLSKIIACIGPSIDVSCYNITKERAKLFQDKFPEYNSIVMIKNNEIFLDLKKIAYLTLLKKGIKQENIEIAPFCTKCNKDSFFSYRSNDMKSFGEFMSFIGLNEKI